jgi:hypothetical protein
MWRLLVGWSFLRINPNLIRYGWGIRKQGFVVVRLIVVASLRKSVQCRGAVLLQVFEFVCFEVAKVQSGEAGLGSSGGRI